MVAEGLQSTVGIRHLIKDAVRVLDGVSLPEDRRRYVLTDLAEFLCEAKKGSDFVRNTSRVVPPAETEAFESFSIVDEYLADYKPGDLATYLQIAKATLEKSLNNEKLSEEDVNKTKRLLLDLLGQVRERAYNRGASTLLDKRLAALGS